MAPVSAAASPFRSGFAALADHIIHTYMLRRRAVATGLRRHGTRKLLHAGGSYALLMCTVSDSTAASAPKRALTVRNIAHARTAVTVGPSQGSRFWLRTCVPLVVIFEALRNYIPAEPSILTLGYLRDVLDLGHHKH